MVFERLQAMIAEQLGKLKSDITIESDIIKDLGADSLDIVEMLMDVEAEWDVIIDDSEVADIKTVGDVVKFINANKK